jgi:hypothetical protein
MHISKTKLFANFNHINIMWMNFNVQIKHGKRQCHRGNKYRNQCILYNRGILVISHAIQRC